MTYTEALEYLHSTTWLGSRLGLERTQDLLRRLGDPHKNLRYVHIAGTNGKGSTAAMLASILTQAGFLTGLATSPSLYRLNERMQVNGKPIGDEELAELMTTVKAAADPMDEPPTEFELITALSFLYFLKNHCDIVVLEVGLGGRLDSTNVIECNEAAVITTIGLDHTEFLGTTLEAIAREKAGIIKQASEVVLSGGQDPSVEKAVRDAAAAQGAHLSIAAPPAVLLREETIRGQHVDWKDETNLFLPLVGAHQRCNAATVLQTVEVLRSRGWSISPSAVREGLAMTVWPGRFEVLHERPLFIVDGGHNPQCAETIAKTLDELLPDQRVTFLMGLLADKDFAGVTGAIARYAKRFITVRPDSPRALSAQQLKEQLERAYPSIPVTACESVTGGIELAIAMNSENDVICAFGSLYMVGEIRNFFKKEELS